MSSEPSSTGLVDDAEFKQLSVDVLAQAHRELFERAIVRVLSTEASELTYAQIVDGLPLVPILCDSSGGGPPKGHPIFEAHEELCPSILEKTREFRDGFQNQILRFDSRLLFTYQAATPGSRSFNTRLIEMVAVAVHQIAVMLFEQDTSLHKDDGITEWKRPSRDRFDEPRDPCPTLFAHPWYTNHKQYPHGVADMAGYWAEARILGGVVLFDRRNPDVDPDSVYFHPDRRDWTYRIYELLPEQKRDLVNYLMAESLPSVSPLPITPSEDNINRVDPEEPLKATGIYRNIWERIAILPWYSDRRMRDVWSTMDFPTRRDRDAAWDRAAERKRRHEYGEYWEASDLDLDL